MARLYQDFLNGDLDTAVSDTDTTLSSPSFADMQAIDSADGDIMALTLDPASAGPEIVHVTDHAADSTNVTVTRGEEGTTAQSHDSGTPWAHAATANDLGGSGGGGDVQIVVHGNDGTVARPEVNSVIWVGRAEPANAQADDLWDEPVE